MGRKNGKTIYLIRHAQSEANVSWVFQSTESPLTVVGQEQAARVAKRLSTVPFEALVSSPLVRARQTAEAIAQQCNMQIEYSDLFVERVKPSRIVGKSVDDREAGSVWDEWTTSLFTPGARTEDGENFDDITARARDALTFLLERPEPRIAVVTHGFFMRVAIAQALFGEKLTGDVLGVLCTRISHENTGATVLRYSPGKAGWSLWTYNDHAHLT